MLSYTRVYMYMYMHTYLMKRTKANSLQNVTWSKLLKRYDIKYNFIYTCKLHMYIITVSEFSTPGKGSITDKFAYTSHGPFSVP